MSRRCPEIGLPSLSVTGTPNAGPTLRSAAYSRNLILRAAGPVASGGD